MDPRYSLRSGTAVIIDEVKDQIHRLDELEQIILSTLEFYNTQYNKYNEAV